jgi:hypothetical protein
MGAVVCFRLRARFRLSDRALVSPSSVGPPVWTAVAMQIGLGRIRGAAAQTRCQAMAREERPVKLGQAQSVAADTQRACLSTRPRATTTHARRCPVWPRRPAHSRTARNVPRTSTNARLGEALSGRDDLRTHAPLHRFRERSQTLAWAKPCLAGRPTMLVRTQSPEQNTSRGRPSGMELPDYPVVATLPTPWDQDGPTPPLPAGSFSVLVPRYASRPVFSRIRNSFCFPSVLSRYLCFL